MQEVKDANAGKGFGHDVGEDGGGRVRVHGADLGGDVVELGQGVDGDEDVGDVEAFGVPENHPGWRGIVSYNFLGQVGGDLGGYGQAMQRFPIA